MRCPTKYHLLKKASLLLILFLSTMYFFYYPNERQDQRTQVTEKSIKVPPQTWFQYQFEKSLKLSNFEVKSSDKWVKWKRSYLNVYFPTIKTKFTIIPKAGSTNWLVALLLAEGALKNITEFRNLDRIHETRVNKFRLIYRKDFLSKKQLLSNAFSFVVIRNPWTRMASGYQDKLSRERAYKYKHGLRLCSEILKKVRGVTDETIELGDLHPTFEEFLKWLVMEKGQVDFHFSPQHEIVSHSTRRYDFIAPLEYSDVLSSKLWRNVDVNTTLRGSDHQITDPRLQTTTLRAKEWISKLDPVLVERVYEVYKADFALANYSNVSDTNFPLPLYYHM